ncbi:MAG: hypothetical protein QNK35_10320, partial [Bacteroides sp.]|nr:hypothetical protein [Bacteroides sp.]
MIRFAFTFLLLAIVALPGKTQSESIKSAKGKDIGSTVTISGVVINGDELGVIRYVQDPTGGIAVYDPDKMGDTKL